MLLQTSEFLRRKVNNGKNSLKGKKALGGALNLMGANLRKKDLRGINLSNSIFITQAQINSAKGDANTRLPKSITRRRHW